MIAEELKKVLSGEVASDKKTLTEYSHDASLFEVMPKVVVFPKNTEDIQKLVRFVNKKRQSISDISLTARSGGTDMTGGPLSQSIIVDFVRHFNRAKEIKDSCVAVEPGMFYRDFEEKTLEQDLLLPTYPASREICTVGGMISNNSGGEKTLRYGKTEKYVKELKVVLSDGNEYVFRRLDKEGLEKKLTQDDFEGGVYRATYKLLEDNYDAIQKARPKVSKNSAGYALWNVWDKKYFDLTQLFVGSQGTLGLLTEATLRLIKTKKHKKLAVLYLKSIESLPDIVNVLLPLRPESLETFDKNTLKLAIRFLPAIARKVKSENLFTLALKFFPDALIQLRMRGLAELVVLVQFAEDTEEEAERRLVELREKLKLFDVRIRTLHREEESEKYWIMRRESFNLLRKHVKGKRTAPFVDDIIVDPSKVPELLPKVYAVLKEYGIYATLAGHAGSGNFHIIPLMDLTKESERKKIPKVAGIIYDLVIKYGGSITAEHNDGLVRSPYLRKMYGEKIYALFEEVKHIFDPRNIFNPGKKVGADLQYAMDHIRKS